MDHLKLAKFDKETSPGLESTPTLNLLSDPVTLVDDGSETTTDWESLSIGAAGWLRPSEPFCTNGNEGPSPWSCLWYAWLGVGSDGFWLLSVLFGSLKKKRKKIELIKEIYF